MADTPMVNMSNPASFAVEWVAGDTGSHYQLVNIRGTTGLMFGARHEGSDQWVTTPVVDPSRFMEHPPKSFREFSAVARKFITG